MDVAQFAPNAPGRLVPISGVSPDGSAWSHHAFLPEPLGENEPELSGACYRSIASARAAVGALDATARHLPNPRLFRLPTMRVEAQATSALEGTFEPLDRVLSEDEATTAGLREVLNYVDVATTAFDWMEAGRPLTVTSLCQLQGMLLAGTPHFGSESGRVRSTQVVIGQRADAPPTATALEASRFVPPPPGPDLEARLRDLLEWMSRDHQEMDPIVVAAMAHYAFESLHPFHDGNGRLGRLLIVLTLLHTGVLSEPTLSASPWFEARRAEYYNNLVGVSTVGSWSGWIAFFAAGIEASAAQTARRMQQLASTQAALKQRISDSPTIRSARAHDLVDHAVAHPVFTASQAAKAIGTTYASTKRLIDALVALGVFAEVGTRYPQRYSAPEVHRVLRENSAT